MPTDIHDRAEAEEVAFAAIEQEIQDALAATRGVSDPGAPTVPRAVAAWVATTLAEIAGEPDPADPDLVARELWSATFAPGAHLALARGALGGIRAQQAVVRAELAGVSTPADTDRLEGELRALLIVDAGLRVEQRHAEERIAAERTGLELLGALVADAEAHVRAVDAHTAWAAEHQDRTDALRDALAEAPLDTVVGDADDVRTGDVLGDAEDRVAELMPDELLERARARTAEAIATVDDRDAAVETATAELDDLAREARPLRAEVDVTTRGYLAAEAALTDYVSGAAARLAMATNLLHAATAHGDLTAEQVAALDAAANADGISAAEVEADLAAALTAVVDAEQVLADALLAALVADPDGDPETDQDVIDARAALEAAALQDPLTAARTALDDASRADLDAWEVEVPDSLWDAVADVELARAVLDALADQAARDQLVTDLDDAEEALADAVDALGVHVRAVWRARLDDADRRAAAAAAERTAPARRIQYVRGDGTGGRTADER